jgi:hypothetical protein
MEWVNQNGQANSYVHALIAPWIVDISGSVILRPNIRLVSQLPDFDVMRQSKEPYYLMFITRDGGNAQNEIDYISQHAKPVYQVVVDRVPILDIFQFGGK